MQGKAARAVRLTLHARQLHEQFASLAGTHGAAGGAASASRQHHTTVRSQRHYCSRHGAIFVATLQRVATNLGPAAAQETGLRHRLWGASEVSARFPVLRLPAGASALWQPGGGMLDGAAAAALLAALAARAGADVRGGARLTGWRDAGAPLQNEKRHGTILCTCLAWLLGISNSQTCF